MFLGDCTHDKSKWIIAKCDGCPCGRTVTPHLMGADFIKEVIPMVFLQCRACGKKDFSGKKYRQVNRERFARKYHWAPASEARR